MSRIQGKTSFPLLATGPVYVGADKSKSHLDVYIHPAGFARLVTNDKSGLTSLVAGLCINVARITLLSDGIRRNKEY